MSYTFSLTLIVTRTVAIVVPVLLPQKEKLLQENVILIGIIPGPKEPSLHMNSFLRPLVDELKQLWVGVRLVNADQQNIIVCGALLCVGCDIPVARKVGGFVGHRATKGCSKCTSPTKHFGDYSNMIATLGNHVPMMNTEPYQYNIYNAIHNQRKIEREYGVRYSVLLELPYFNAPRMCVIDPMHNLLLGTAKHTIEVWKHLSILDSKTFNIIQQNVDGFIAPPDIGRFPSDIRVFWFHCRSLEELDTILLLVCVTKCH